MKKNLLFPILAFAVIISAALSSCTGIGKKLNFDLNMVPVSVTVTIPVYSDTTGTITIGPNSNSYNVDSFIAAQTGGSLHASSIQSVKVKSVTLSLSNADNENNFQNFRSVSASFYSNSNSTPYQVTISNNPDVYATTLSLPVDQTTDLKSYIGNMFTYTISGSLRHPIKKALTCTITYSFDLVVQG